MSDFFKPRKPPKHLIIQEESDFPRKRRFNTGKLLFLVVLILCVTGVLLQLR